MKKILVPTDFSTCAYKAIDFAVQSAKYLPVEVTLLHCFEPESNIYTDYVGLNQGFREQLLASVHKKLEDVKILIEETEGVRVNTYVAVTPLVDAVKTAVAELGIDMVVMGTLGITGLKEKIWGSKTATLIGIAPVPVMVIPFEYEWKQPKNIFLSTNHFEKGPALLDFLFDLADMYAAKVQVAVMTDVDDDGAATFLEHGRSVAPYQEFLQERYKDKSIMVEHLYGQDFEETLQQYITKKEIDIVVMITYQQGFWKRLFFPSMTKRMSYHTSIPLLALPSKGEGV